MSDIVVVITADLLVSRQHPWSLMVGGGLMMALFRDRPAGGTLRSIVDVNGVLGGGKLVLILLIRPFWAFPDVP